MNAERSQGAGSKERKETVINVLPRVAAISERMKYVVPVSFERFAVVLCIYRGAG